MNTKKHLTLKFYQNLGKLFYAIAAADNKVHEAEINTLKELVKKEWLDVDDIEDGFGTDAAYQIEIVFDWLFNEQDTGFNIKTCYDDFISYKKDQKHLFTNNVNRLILKTANAIADSFSGKNKSELILLGKLNIELNKE
ncbi:hypothetical protein [Confluentibacter flavum]|uniref:Co-chaperone DjlA N-terminal domain-containing protein n=1 Tax=Confluentibacter flavum TaxID=1909700 RepID=A0A2N3HJH2_9FLAO|nr:hypothetical protein [Confluentibacter flavum]PKQ45130.1 hypothetical protein CSW08_09570 [Confluentibacter flavum]